MTDKTRDDDNDEITGASQGAKAKKSEPDLEKHSNRRTVAISQAVTRTLIRYLLAASEKAEKENEASLEIEAAKKRRTWTRSDERKRANRAFWWVVFGIPVSAVAGFVGALYIKGPWTDQSYPELTAAFGAVTVWIYFTWYPLISYKRRMRREFEDRLLLADAREELDDADAEVISGSTDFPTLWHATQKRLDYYHKIATTQSERSFLYGQIAAGSGLAILLTAAMIAGLSHSTAASVVAGATGIVGGGIGAYVGATFTKTQEQSAVQLRAYFLQPLEFSKYLAAERLLSQLDGEERHRAIHLIITGIVNHSQMDAHEKGQASF